MNAKDSDKLFNDPDAFRQRVRMAAVQVAGLRPEELEAALAYEVEPFSGIPAAEAVVACRPVVEPDPSVRVYDVAVRRRGKTAAAGGLERLLKPAYALGLALIALAVVDAGVLARRQAGLSARVAEQTRLDLRLQAIRGAAQARRSEALAVRQAREAAVAAQEAAARLRAAFPELLSVIGSSFSDKAVLKTMSSAAGARTVKLAAVSATSQDMAEALARLSERSAAKGWKLRTGSMAVQAAGKTVSFDCEVSHD